MLYTPRSVALHFRRAGRPCCLRSAAVCGLQLRARRCRCTAARPRAVYHQRAGRRPRSVAVPMPDMTKTLFVLWASVLAVAVAGSSRAAGQAVPAFESNLWGAEGSLWDRSGKARLLDFSYAGFKEGTVLPPNADALEATVSVTSYGAVGDGVTDCLAAFEAAIRSGACQAAQQCVVYVPPGTYALRNQLHIRSSIILRGAGRDVTTLYFPRSWSNITGSYQQRQWSFGPGLLTFNGSIDASSQTLLSDVVYDSPMGSNIVFVRNATKFSKGQWIKIKASEPGGAGAHIGPRTTPLINYLYGESARLVNTSYLTGRGGAELVRAVARVADVGDGFIELDRRLPIDIRTNWKKVAVHAFNYPGSDDDAPVVGIEGVTVQFPDNTTYRGHFREEGYNGVFFDHTSNCFARDVRVLNADFSMQCSRCYFCTFMNVTIESNRTAKDGVHGHHAFNLGRSMNTLVTDFDVVAPQVHDLSLDSAAAGNVYRNGRGTDLRIDFHRYAPYGNLVSNVHLGTGDRVWDYAGAVGKGPQAAARNTLWNLHTDGRRTLGLPCPSGTPGGYGCAEYGHLLNFVGDFNDAQVPDGWWVEDVAGQPLDPQDLYSAQVMERLGRLVYPDEPSVSSGAQQGGAPSRGWGALAPQAVPGASGSAGGAVVPTIDIQISDAGISITSTDVVLGGGRRSCPYGSCPMQQDAADGWADSWEEEPAAADDGGGDDQGAGGFAGGFAGGVMHYVNWALDRINSALGHLTGKGFAAVFGPDDFSFSQDQDQDGSAAGDAPFDVNQGFGDDAGAGAFHVGGGSGSGGGGSGGSSSSSSSGSTDGGFFMEPLFGGSSPVDGGDTTLDGAARTGEAEAVTDPFVKGILDVLGGDASSDSSGSGGSSSGGSASSSSSSSSSSASSSTSGSASSASEVYFIPDAQPGGSNAAAGDTTQGAGGDNTSDAAGSGDVVLNLLGDTTSILSDLFGHMWGRRRLRGAASLNHKGAWRAA